MSDEEDKQIKPTVADASSGDEPSSTAAGSDAAPKGGKASNLWQRLIARLKGKKVDPDPEQARRKSLAEQFEGIKADPRAAVLDFLYGFGDLVRTMAYALLLAALIRTVIFQPFWIPTGSMKPTLLIGDFLFVNKYAYGFSAYSCPNYGAWNMCAFWEGAESSQDRLWATDPERGDVVVFRHPVAKEDYIKRLVGLPGDTIETRDGILYINGEAAPQEPDGRFVETYGMQGSMGGFPKCIVRTALGTDCVKARAIETLPGGVQHPVLDVRNERQDNYGPVTVPEDHFFFMGDNRDNSTDSRFSQIVGGVGFVHQEYLVGRADRVVFSSAGRSILYFWTWRSDRYFQPIN